MKTKTFKIFVSALICAAVFCGGFIFVSAKQDYPEPTESFFVNDFAGILSDQTEAEILKKGAAVFQQTTAQVVVITVETLGGEDAGSYALNIGREWGIGQKGKDNGVVVLVSSGERQIYTAVGYGLEGALPDSKTGRLLDYYAVEHLKKNDYSTGISKLYDAITNEIYIEYGIDTPKDYVPIDEVDNPSTVSIIISWVVLLAFLIGMRILAKRHGMSVFIPFITFGGRGGRGGRGGFGGFGGSGGGFGGFSGGGGSFGGGGAGRGF